MTEFAINYWAVLAAGIAAMVVGGLWYSPILFGKMWMKLSGMSQEKIAEAKKKGMAKTYTIAFIGTLVMAYILAHFLAVGGAATISGALAIAFWLWLGFVVTIKLGDVLWAGDPIKLYIVSIAHYLVAIAAMAVILTLWK